jgi:hypothetical protein
MYAHVFWSTGLFVSYTFENINEMLCNMYVISGNEQQLKCKYRDLKEHQDARNVQF